MSDALPKPLEEKEARSSRYEVLAKIASGGMATVFVGRVRGAVGFSRLVAVKRPHAFVSKDLEMKEGLEHEARIASMIHHPHVVSILDVELLGNELALILDYVEGGTLQDLVAHAMKHEAPLPIGVAVRIVLDTASGLHAAHVLRDSAGTSLGIVHRDVSPQNILVGIDGQSRLTDFGIAKIANQCEQTASGILKGKLAYLPPEYVASRGFDPRSDEYALAVVAWEILAGRRMFAGLTDGEVLRQIVNGVAPALSAVRAELAPLDPVFARALARDPADRYESVAAFAEELEARAREGARERGREIATEQGWVASHGEVGTLVDSAVGAKVRQRRAAIEASLPLPVSMKIEVARVSSSRDAMATLSLPAGELPPSDETIADPMPPIGLPAPVLDGEGAEGVAAESPPVVTGPVRRSVRRWWPVAPVVVVAALTGFAITRGLLRPSSSPVAAGSAYLVDTASAPAVAPVPTPDFYASDPTVASPPPSPPAEDPPSVPAPSALAIPTTTIQAPSRPEGRSQPPRVFPRPPRRVPATAASSEARGAGAAVPTVPVVPVVPARAPPNPYGP
jgi:hypothetical protein